MDYFNEINIGAAANDGNGDPLRTGANTVNQNFTEAETQIKARVEEAPNNGNSYVRRDSAWEIINSGGGGMYFEYSVGALSSGYASFGEVNIDSSTPSSITTIDIAKNDAAGMGTNDISLKSDRIMLRSSNGTPYLYLITKNIDNISYSTLLVQPLFATTDTLSVGDSLNISYLKLERDTPIIPDYLKGVADVGDDNTSLWLITPKSQYYNGNTYFVYIDFNDNKRKIAQYNHATDVWKVTDWAQTSFVGGFNSTNKDYAHASPSVFIDSKGIVHITYSSAKNAGIYYIRTSNAEDISSFDPEITIATGTDVSASYTSMIEHNDKTILFYRGEYSGKSAIRRVLSLDDGATWVNDVLIIENTGTDPNGRVYYQTKISRGGRLHLSFHNSETPYGNHDLFHVYSDNVSDSVPSFYTLENPSTLETLPLDLTGNAKIFDSVAAGWDTCYMLGSAIDNDGYIHIAAYCKEASDYGELLHFYWTGSAWSNNIVVKEDLSSWTVGSIQGDFINHNGMLLLMTEYISDPDYGTYGKSEIIEYISFDMGFTWKTSGLVTTDTTTTTANPFYIRGTRNIGWFEGDNDYGVGKRVLMAQR